MVAKCRRQFKAGKQVALLDAIDFCARAGLSMPLWLAEAFCARYLEWVRFRAKTLDEAFRVARPKGARLDDRARRERLRGSVILRVLLLSREGVPRLEAFERVGAELGISNKLAEAIFYERESRSWRWLFDQFETLERS